MRDDDGCVERKKTEENRRKKKQGNRKKSTERRNEGKKQIDANEPCGFNQPPKVAGDVSPTSPSTKYRLADADTSRETL